MTSLKTQYGQWALVTGSTVGIGQAFSQQLAQEGIHLVTVARSEAALQTQAQALRDQYGIEVHPIAADLSTPQGVEHVMSATQTLSIDILIMNAAIIDAQHAFVDTPIEFCNKMLQLNTISVMQLTHHFAARMKERGHGAVLLLASISGLMPQPYLGLYGATKAFVHSLATSMGPELKPHGVQVSVLSPGPTRTAMLHDTGMKHEKIGLPVATPQDVARCGLNALRRRRLHVIPGWINRIAVMSSFLLPDHYASPIIGWVMRQGFDRPPRAW
jgi:short-subunit dehydrogenase